MKSTTPARIFSYATGAGGLASYAFFDRMDKELPMPLTGTADSGIQHLTKSAHEIYICELYATVATEHTLQSELADVE